jgi:hypothetical protein
MTPYEMFVTPGDLLECVGWTGSRYTKGKVYPVVEGYGVPQQTVGNLIMAGDWRIVRQVSLAEQVKELLG